MPNASDRLGANLGASVILNGDGNGFIDGTENMILFQHLAAAGFISGIYDATAQPLVGLMASTTDSELTFSIATSSNEIYIRISRYQAGTGIGVSAFSPQEAWKCDQKYDDGIPGEGIIRASAGTGNIGNCLDVAAYDLENEDKACIMEFRSKAAPASVVQAAAVETGCSTADGDIVAAASTRTDENCDDYGFASKNITETCVDGGNGKFYWEVNSGQTCP